MPNYDLALDEYNDLVIENGDLSFVVDPRLALKQRMNICFRTFTKEWWWKQSFGGLDRDLLFTKGVSKNIIDAWFLTKINEFEEVLQVLQFDSVIARAERTYTLNFIVQVVDGTLESAIDAGFIPARSELVYPSAGIYQELLATALDDLTNWWEDLSADDLLILDLPDIMSLYYTISWV